MKKRIVASEAFAWQFAQACLRHPLIPHQYKNMMMHMEMSSDSGFTASVSMLVRIYKVPDNIRFEFRLQRGESDITWTSGECIFALGGQDWKFAGNVVDNQMTVELIERPAMRQPAQARKGESHG